MQDVVLSDRLKYVFVVKYRLHRELWLEQIIIRLPGLMIVSDCYDYRCYVYNGHDRNECNAVFYLLLINVIILKRTQNAGRTSILFILLYAGIGK